MASERLIEIFTLMANHEREHPNGVSLCSVAREITELSGAGISISSKDGTHAQLCASNGVAQSLMDLEITFEEGPGHEASKNGTANEVSDLLGDEAQRWAFYSPEAAELGVRAVFGFPIHIGAVVFGALSLYRDRTGPLSEKQSSGAYLMASVIGRAVLVMQAGAPQGSIADELQGQATFDFSVHQAAGMLAVQAKLSVKDALVMLRSHAFVVEMSPSELAQRIISGETRFDVESESWRVKE
ncbi:MAG: GAF domain-containing protein [Acidobacteria bacterium]|nr:GAF domain-containing protein [Acidobacteriota bacterium]